MYNDIDEMKVFRETLGKMYLEDDSYIVCVCRFAA